MRRCSASSSYRRQLVDLFRSNAAALLGVNGSNELINLGGSLGSRYALMFAPLSIVQAIGSTTTLFVFALGILLSVFYPQFGRETLSWRDLLQKGAGRSLGRDRRRAGHPLSTMRTSSHSMRAVNSIPGHRPPQAARWPRSLPGRTTPAAHRDTSADCAPDRNRRRSTPRRRGTTACNCRQCSRCAEP